MIKIVKLLIKSLKETQIKSNATTNAPAMLEINI